LGPNNEDQFQEPGRKAGGKCAFRQVLKVLWDFVQAQAVVVGTLKELILQNPGINWQFWVVFAQNLQKQKGCLAAAARPRLNG
jgi:hypothetical protein